MSARHDARVFLGSAGALPLFAAPEAPADNKSFTHEAVFRSADEAPSPDHGPPAVVTGEPAIDPAVLAPAAHPGMIRVAAGRAYHVEGEPRVAPHRAGSAWAGGAEPLVAGLDPATRKALGEAWIAAALDEHASVAAFAQLALALLALGASADLVARTEQAAMQEVEHARLCFALASAYFGSPVAPGPLPVGKLASPSLVQLAIESWHDGCLGEGAAASVARAARRRAHDPAVCAVLSLISRDEAAHAELAWDVLAFCLARGGRDVADALREEVARTAHVAAPIGSERSERSEHPPDEHDGALAALLAEHGQLSPTDRARSVAEATRTAVRRAGWLLAPGSAPHALRG